MVSATLVFVDAVRFWTLGKGRSDGRTITQLNRQERESHNKEVTRVARVTRFMEFMEGIPDKHKLSTSQFLLPNNHHRLWFPQPFRLVGSWVIAARTTHGTTWLGDTTRPVSNKQTPSSRTLSPPTSIFHLPPQTSISLRISLSRRILHLNIGTSHFPVPSWLISKPLRLPQITKKPSLCMTSEALVVSPSIRSAIFYAPADRTLPWQKLEIWKRL